MLDHAKIIDVQSYLLRNFKDATVVVVEACIGAAERAERFEVSTEGNRYALVLSSALLRRGGHEVDSLLESRKLAELLRRAGDAEVVIDLRAGRANVTMRERVSRGGEPV